MGCKALSVYHVNFWKHINCMILSSSTLAISISRQLVGERHYKSHGASCSYFVAYVRIYFRFKHFISSQLAC